MPFTIGYLTSLDQKGYFGAAYISAALDRRAWVNVGFCRAQRTASGTANNMTLTSSLTRLCGICQLLFWRVRCYLPSNAKSCFLPRRFDWVGLRVHHVVTVCGLLDRIPQGVSFLWLLVVYWLEMVFFRDKCTVVSINYDATNSESAKMAYDLSEAYE